MTAEEFLAYLRQAILQANTNDLDTTLQIVADVQNSITEFNSQVSGYNPSSPTTGNADTFFVGWGTNAAQADITSSAVLAGGPADANPIFAQFPSKYRSREFSALNSLRFKFTINAVADNTVLQFQKQPNTSFPSTNNRPSGEFLRVSFRTDSLGVSVFAFNPLRTIRSERTFTFNFDDVWNMTFNNGLLRLDRIYPTAGNVFTYQTGDVNDVIWFARGYRSSEFSLLNEGIEEINVTQT